MHLFTLPIIRIYLELLYLFYNYLLTVLNWLVLKGQLELWRVTQ